MRGFYTNLFHIFQSYNFLAINFQSWTMDNYKIWKMVSSSLHSGVRPGAVLRHGWEREEGRGAVEAAAHGGTADGGGAEKGKRRVAAHRCVQGGGVDSASGRWWTRRGGEGSSPEGVARQRHFGVQWQWLRVPGRWSNASCRGGGLRCGTTSAEVA
jgi:hypothetical protein